MEVLRVLLTWLVKISFWGATGLLAAGVAIERSPWWLAGFGLFWLVSFPALGKYKMSWGAIVPHLLCNAYFLFVLNIIVTNKNSNVWWLIVALILEFVIIGRAQNIVDEAEKKSEIARDTEKRFAEEKKRTVQAAGSVNTVRKKMDVPSTGGKKVAENAAAVSQPDKSEDDFWKWKIEQHIHQLKSDGNDVVRYIGDLLGLSYSDEDPVSGELKKENASELRSKFFMLFGESILKLAQEENISIKSNRLAGLYADTIFIMCYQADICNAVITKIFSLSSYIGTEQSKKFMNVLSDFVDKIPASAFEKEEKEEMTKKDEFPHFWFYRRAKKYSSDLNGKGGTFASCYPDQVLAWCSDQKDECLTDYVLRNLKDFLHQSPGKNQGTNDSDIGKKSGSSGNEPSDEIQTQTPEQEKALEARPPRADEEPADSLTETLRAVEEGDWKKAGAIVGKGIWNSLKENAEETRRFRREFENLSPYELAAICKNTWKSSTERAAAFHVLKMKVPNEAERRRLLR